MAFNGAVSVWSFEATTSFPAWSLRYEGIRPARRSARPGRAIWTTAGVPSEGNQWSCPTTFGPPTLWMR
jgi:hypothetical protein